MLPAGPANKTLDKDLISTSTRKSLTRKGFYALVYTSTLILTAITMVGCAQRPMSSPVIKNQGIASDSGPTWSPDGNHIAFVSNRDGNNEIYMVAIDNGYATRLTSNEASDTSPAWSPSGDHIAFVSNRNGNHEIYSIELANYQSFRLTDNKAWDSIPIWSPNGMQISFVSDRDGGQELYVMNSDGTQQTRQTHGVTAKEIEPTSVSKLSSLPKLVASWSPTGDRLIFHAYQGGNNWEIFVVSIQSGELEKLTSNDSTDIFPTWSPDGSQIAFSSGRDGNWEIYLMEPGGSSQTRITHNASGDIFPIWSPDGSRIIFLSDRHGNRELYSIYTDGSMETRLTSGEAEEGSPTWSLTRQKVAFNSETNGISRIFIMDTDGSDLIDVAGSALE